MSEAPSDPPLPTPCGAAIEADAATSSVDNTDGLWPG